MKNPILETTLLIFSAAFSAPAQTYPPQSFSPVIIDLDGQWEGDGISYIFKHDGERFWAIESLQESPSLGKMVFSGHYQGENRFTVTIPPAFESIAKEFLIQVRDPDTVAVNGHVLKRITPPQLNDLPCSADNPYKVTAAGALARGWVAARAQEQVSAFCWTSLSASMGNPEAEYQKGASLAAGYGTPRDLHAAFYWIELSAHHKNVDGMRDVADMLDHGWGTPRDPQTAARWREVAAEMQLDHMLGLDTPEGRADAGRRILNGFGSSEPVNRFHCADDTILELPQRVKVPGGYDVCSGHGGMLLP